MVLIKNVYTPVICKTTKSPTVIEWTTFPIVWTQQMAVFELFQPKKMKEGVKVERYHLMKLLLTTIKSYEIEEIQGVEHRYMNMK